MILVHGASRSGHNFVEDMIMSWTQEDVIDCENMSFKDSNILAHRLGGSNIRSVVQTRDYMNWMASWIKYILNRNLGDVDSWVESRLNFWKIYSKEFFGYTHDYDNFVPVFYDEFVKSREYREKVCDSLGGSYNEDKIDAVPKAGRGSSFDSREYDGRGSQMRVLNRWEWFYTEEGQRYEHYLYQDKEALQHYISNYNFTGVEQLEYAELLLKREYGI